MEVPFQTSRFFGFVFSRILSIHSLQLWPVNSTGFSGVEKWLVSFAAIKSQSDDFSDLAASTSLARSMSF